MRPRWRSGEDRYPPLQPITDAFLHGLALAVELHTGLDSSRTRDGLAVARSRGQLQGWPPKLTATHERHIVELYQSDHDTVGKIGALFNVSRSTVYRAVRRADRAANPDAPPL